jgi:hypothetical protein
MALRVMRTAVCVCLIWLCLWSSAAARYLYVNNMSGDDRSDGTQPSPLPGGIGPVRTIAKALRLADSGDRISVANTGQAYRETVCLTGERHSGSVIGPFVIQGNGATLDGSASLSGASWTYQGGDVFYFQPARLGYQQLFFDTKGRLALRHPVAQSAVSLPPLEPLEWCLWNGKIYFRVEPGRLPAEYDLACCKLQTGISLYHVHDVVIENMTIQGFHIDGCNAADGVRFAILRGLTCRANGRNGISVNGSSRVDIDQCVLTENGQAQLRVDDQSHATVIASRLLDNTAPAWVQDGGELTIDGRRTATSQP